MLVTSPYEKLSLIRKSKATYNSFFILLPDIMIEKPPPSIPSACTTDFTSFLIVNIMLYNFV